MSKKIKSSPSNEVSLNLQKAGDLTQNRINELLEDVDNYYFENDFEKVIELSGEVLKLDPVNPIAFNYMGVSYCFLNRYDEALTVLNHNLKIHPNNYYVRNNLSMVYYDLGDYETSLRYCEEGLEIKDFNWLCVNKLKSLIKLKRIDEAVEYSKNLTAVYDIAELFLKDGETEGALKYYQSRLNPENPRSIDIVKHNVFIKNLSKDVLGDFYMTWIEDIESVDNPNKCPVCGEKLAPVIRNYTDLDESFIAFRCVNNCRDSRREFKPNLEIECMNPVVETYVNQKIFRFNEILRKYGEISLGGLKYRLLEDKLEADAFVNHLIEIGYIVKSSKTGEKDDIVFDESRYPMNYLEFEKRIIELFLENYTGKSLGIMSKKIRDELANTPNFIETLYGQTCFVYDHPEIYGEISKDAFKDYQLRRTPVYNLMMYL